jgi:aldehyde dehydrogenase (NAD+)
MTATFDSLDPATGDVAGTYPEQGPDEVRAAVARAHGATDLIRGAR